MMKQIYCTNCGNPHIKLDSIYLDVTVQKSKHCDKCYHSNQTKKNLMFCSVECFQEWTTSEFGKNQLKKLVEKFDTDEQWSYKPEYDTVSVMINGREFNVVRNLGYTQIVELAQYDDYPYPVTVTYAHAKDDKSGILNPRDRLSLVNGTIINVADTSNA